MRVGEKRRKDVTESRVEKEEDQRVQLFSSRVVQCHGRVPHYSARWFPARQEVTSQGHCFAFLYGLHEKRPLSPAAPQSTECDPHKTVKGNNSAGLCAYCLYTHHMSRRTECHHRLVGTSTSSVGAALLYNVRDASSLSRCTNLQPPPSLSVKKWSVTQARWHTESH